MAPTPRAAATRDPLRLPVLRTARLEILPATSEALEASIRSREAFARVMGRPIAADWPPKEWDAGPVQWLLARMGEHPGEPFWRSWFVALAADPDTRGAPGPVIGTCGCKGPPSPMGTPPTPSDPDHDCAVEVGYGIVTSLWRRGFGSEAAAALCEWVLADPRVKLLRAHTLAGDPASGGVLRRCGFRHVRTVDDPADGRVDRYERPRV